MGHRGGVGREQGSSRESSRDRRLRRHGTWGRTYSGHGSLRDRPAVVGCTWANQEGRVVWVTRNSLRKERREATTYFVEKGLVRRFTHGFRYLGHLLRGPSTPGLEGHGRSLSVEVVPSLRMLQKSSVRLPVLRVAEDRRGRTRVVRWDPVTLDPSGRTTERDTVMDKEWEIRTSVSVRVGLGISVPLYTVVSDRSGWIRVEERRGLHVDLSGCPRVCLKGPLFGPLCDPTWVLPRLSPSYTVVGRWSDVVEVR